ncbi:CotD family spore coat protein [Gracilibacillus halophilus]|uniref:CotD family spore coat protein n=1 Tax=Gracilibacillus halophilus TaxID=470864 RepID=UPI001F08945E|nr:CotD family spore coat protein [Gracilibacillus halophilus]
MRHMRPFGRPRCQMPSNTVVCPTKSNVVHTCSESEVNYIHPSHTTVVNHHLVKNKHHYPHTTSYENTVNQVNMNAGPGNPMNQNPMNQNPMGQNPMTQGNSPFGNCPR